MTESSALLALSNDPVWFCLRAEPKREHLAATALRRRFGIDCLSPRLRFRKLTEKRPVWFVEAMFPAICLRNLCIPLSVAQSKAPTESGGSSVWRASGNPAGRYRHCASSKAGAEEVVTVDSSPKIGQPVQLIEGPFQGLEVVVTQLLPRGTDPSVARCSGGRWRWKSPRQKCSCFRANYRTSPKWPFQRDGHSAFQLASRPGRVAG